MSFGDIIIRFVFVASGLGVAASGFLLMFWSLWPQRNLWLTSGLLAVCALTMAASAHALAH